jgi:DNA polymerase-3 subunit alpha/error-prone DNA polymerase
LPLEAPAFESVIIIYAFIKAPKQLKTNEYIGVRPEEIGKLFGYKGSLEKMIVLQPVTFRTKKKNTNCIKYLERIDNNLLSLTLKYRYTYRGSVTETLAGSLQDSLCSQPPLLFDPF